MCGIVGYVGMRQAVPILMDGLARLSYRGYDSAGVAVMDPSGRIAVKKAKGKLDRLQKVLDQGMLEGHAGIGHTRWATHGEPSDINAHPHTDLKGGIAVVHNGILENHASLRRYLQQKGIVFVSQTDTEVIAHLLNDLYAGDMLAALTQAIRMMEGSYALGVLCDQEPERLYCVRNDSPLVVGFQNGEGFLASDIPAILSHTRDVVLMEDREIGMLDRSGFKVYDEYGRPKAQSFFHVDWEQADAEKGGYPHFMLKEIHEQPEALQRTIQGRIRSVSWFPLPAEKAQKVKKITIVACGTAYHAGVYAKHVIEVLARIPSQAEMASEYRYRNPLIGPDEIILAVSQSGETADTLAAVREARKRGADVYAVCNVVGSSLVREVGEDHTLYTYAGPEIAVASTKAYLTQTAVLIQFAAKLAQARKTCTETRLLRLAHGLEMLPQHAAQLLLSETQIQRAASRYMHKKHVFYVGRGLDYALSMEAALKLKEVSYIYAEAYPAGELKHGPLALVQPGELVIAAVTQPDVADKTIGNLQEAAARGAEIIAAACTGMDVRLRPLCKEVFVVPQTDPLLSPLLAAIPMQLFAYYMAAERGCDVDQPRNLAKSVTVE